MALVFILDIMVLKTGFVCDFDILGVLFIKINSGGKV